MSEISAEDIQWATEEADRIGTLPTSPSLGFPDEDERGELLGAVEFLRLKAGPRSELYIRASEALEKGHMSVAPQIVISALRTWADFVGRGVVEIPVEAQARIAAATDLMEQVEKLLQDRAVHPAGTCSACRRSA